MGMVATILGLAGALFSIAWWIVFVFFNPYVPMDIDETVLITFFLTVLPALFAMRAATFNQRVIMAIAFVWSLPVSVYLLQTPGIFKWFIASSIAYLLSLLFMMFSK